MRAKRLYLTVPPAHRERVLALGGKWDHQEHRVYLTRNRDRSPFLPWLPSGVKEGVILFPPVYLATAATTCWSCRGAVDALALGAVEYWQPGHRDVDDGFALVAHVGFLPDWTLRLIQGAFPYYGYAYYRYQGRSRKVLVSHCPSCGHVQGDKPLIRESGGALNPSRPRDAQTIDLMMLIDHRSLAAPAVPVPHPMLFHYARSGPGLAS